LLGRVLVSKKRAVFFVVLVVFFVVAAFFWRPTIKPTHWTVIEVRYLKNGSCSFVAEWGKGVLSIPEYIKAESQDSKHQLCPQLGDTLNAPRLDILTVSAGSGDEKRSAEVIERWRGQDFNPH
jgi:hypothetical protein